MLEEASKAKYGMGTNGCQVQYSKVAAEVLGEEFARELKQAGSLPGMLSFNHAQLVEHLLCEMQKVFFPSGRDIRTGYGPHDYRNRLEKALPVFSRSSALRRWQHDWQKAQRRPGLL